MWYTAAKLGLMPIVELQQIRKVYDTKVAVDDLSFTIEPGTMFGLLGPNGSGKTSTIRMMIGITVPDSGAVRLFGKPFDRAQPESRRLPARRARPLQEDEGDRSAHLPRRAAWPRRHRGHASARMPGANALQITEAIAKKTEELSKGMQQKIQFIATLLHEPDLIIMDEPFSGLDPVNATLLKDTLIDLRKQGKAILFSTHRMDQVEKLCDSIALISRTASCCSPEACARSSRAIRAIACVMTFEGDDSFLQSRLRRGVQELLRPRRDHAPDSPDSSRGCTAAACCRPSHAAHASPGSR